MSGFNNEFMDDDVFKDISAIEEYTSKGSQEGLGDGSSFATRITSSFPISIGTALALESIFLPRTQYYDIGRKIPNEIVLESYDEIWINVATLVRNLRGSVTSQVIKNTEAKELVEYLIADMGVILDLFIREGAGVCKVNFYTCSYSSLKNKYSNSKIVKFREKTTFIQRHEEKLDHDTIKELIKRYPNDIVRFDSKITSKTVSPKALVLTHVPYDLCSYRTFAKFDLLESHTGILKSRRDWASKYNVFETERYLWLPFLEKMLLIFGDPYLIKPMLPGIRKEVIRIGRMSRWTPMTTLDKVNMDLTQITEDYVRHLIVSL